MDTVLPNAQSSAGFTSMNSGWGPSLNNCAAKYGTSDSGDADLSLPLGGENFGLSFADTMSAFTNQEPADHKPYSPAITTDPMMWRGPNGECETASISGRHDSAYSSSGTPKSAKLESPGILPYPSLGIPTITATEGFGMAWYSSPVSPTETAGSGMLPYPTPVSPTTTYPESPPEHIQQESDSTCRARYAANQRHQKARNCQQQQQQKAARKTSASDTNTNTNSSNENSTKAEEKKRTLREKNKLAAAKCRQRQRKQAETIRTKSSQLSETNAQLKSHVQELRGELNGLRALALGHGKCNSLLARYNQVQAERVMRDYYSACGGLAGEMVDSSNNREQQQQAEPQ